MIRAPAASGGAKAGHCSASPLWPDGAFIR